MIFDFLALFRHFIQPSPDAAVRVPRVVRYGLQDLGERFEASQVLYTTD